MADVQKLVDKWRQRKINAILAMLGGLLQRKYNRPTLVENGVPTENNSEIVAA
ncbi:MAG: hypothetical protein KME60_14385 [Cyanomargarita calcarea GSE-NOS-MK-12-04C]|uniref:Uncharacterized protein n=1 Tax=Cyanomargarita calcarea GSE-NOS-MK-12-04C TaxID=2839659 RepID=A0A951QP55_9CYAN|nr:hypothetical protein [Cyanomargarita calcarea GSE-NOS-MK-12-04C]